ncbi:hypothetical protein N7478_005804 [Penicillium angulare]|uniref:uncharacterized protein n=1 Tax=Penicillium angulare TaxID=116970 RepID=UPI002541EF7D|nr:uncharacterized protein N7478_005804 [Penicillium angulare]KAJ5280432.1 hypothetical protein N7478_005804 [Penicillium angulare]
MASQASRRAESSTHTRSFTGCGTCRNRHVKCDEARPTCSMCAEYGLSCAGYKNDIFFDTEFPDNRIRFRRPLLTEKERQRMSQWLISAAPPRSTNRLLLRLDEEVESHENNGEEIQLVVGPFGVFKSHKHHNEQSSLFEDAPAEHDVIESCTSSPPQEISQILDPFTPVPDISQWSPGFMESLLERSEQDTSPVTSDLLDMVIEQSHLENTPMTSQEYQLNTFLPNPYCNSLSHTSIMSPPSVTSAVPPDAVFLLRHYSSKVISLMTPVRHKKTPWHILFIPHVKNCLAALALGEDLNNASLCTFFGTLAISAFSLGGVSRSESWLEQGKTYLQRASEHAKAMLITAYDVPKPAKYKSILMGILTMIQVSNFSGNRHQAEGYFLEAEKIIRLKGLKRKKSRKVRLLHHCYVFERMFHESIFICGANSVQRHHLRRAIESSGLSRCSVDGLSFRLYKWQNLQQEMERVRGREEGENDLHLERPGLFSATLYPEIFGVPEAWLVLLSSVIRLGVEKDGAEQDIDGDGLNLKDYISRAKALEDYINQLQRPSQMSFSSATHQSKVDQHILENMLEAMRNALVIYFYRRIYDLNASMLQEKVANVRDCLLQCEYADSSVVHGSAGFIWPAFIAACEAEDPGVQSSFSSWFEISASRSGLSCFNQTLDSIHRIWEEKSRGSRSSITWLDLMKRAGYQHHGLVI